MLKKFKDFIARGNVIDMAVGVIVGGAFKEIVNSLVADIFTPVISLFTGGVDFSELSWIIKPEVLDAEGVVVAEELAVKYGAFIQNIFDFILVALCVFLFVELAQSVRMKAEALKKKEEEAAVEAAEEEPAKPSNEELLLTEIRDLLKEKNS
jgi:large conductance mechanosensitive channel